MHFSKQFIRILERIEETSFIDAKIDIGLVQDDVADETGVQDDVADETDEIAGFMAQTLTPARTTRSSRALTG